VTPGAGAAVTTVRRRSRDLAIPRAIGVPLGIVVGRAVGKQLAVSFPVVYVPPLALVAVVLIVPTAIIIVNAPAAGPAHAATRIRPAQALRTE
jgi:ABC-type antimicrobial peptide transport system permease subunit